MTWAIELKGVSKAFVLRHNPAHNLKVRLIGVFHPRHREQLEEHGLQPRDPEGQRGDDPGLSAPDRDNDDRRIARCREVLTNSLVSLALRLAEQFVCLDVGIRGGEDLA